MATAVNAAATAATVAPAALPTSPSAASPPLPSRPLSHHLEGRGHQHHHHHEHHHHHHEAAAAQPLITQQQVQEWVHEASGILGAIRRLGLPATSWRNKMPYRVPRAEPLARGLKWPEQHEFANEHEKRVFLRSQRRLQPFLLGDIPQWSWFAADVALLFFLTYEPRWPWALD
ncbi:unnamed protein product [Closterium sp. NIES-65]|nr:unnamed protein product [Closterium sp. NIES-65]